MRKTILLDYLPLTAKKKGILKDFFFEYLRVLNSTLEELPKAKSLNELHHLTYSNIRSTSFLPSDIVQEACKEVWAKRKTVNSGFTRCSIPLNKRWFKLFTTERGTPCFRITYSPRKTFVIPVKINNGYKRFNRCLEDGWVIKTISLLLHDRIAISLMKEYPKPTIDLRRYVVGVDVGSTTLAAVTIIDTKTLKTMKQFYLGRDVAIKQRKYLERRQKLQSHAASGSEKAKKYLKQIKRKQADFVKTRSGQIAKEIVNIAKSYNASIAIEKLSIHGRRGKFNKKANRKINHIPHAQLRDSLLSNCELYETPLDQIDAYHTSKWCPHCGSVNKGHSSVNYAIYKCKTCGKIVNSDRKASKVIAIKSALERELSQDLTNLFTQLSSAGVAVNQLFRPGDEAFAFAVRNSNPLMGNQLL